MLNKPLPFREAHSGESGTITESITGPFRPHAKFPIVSLDAQARLIEKNTGRVESSPDPVLERVRVKGKFLFLGDQKFWVRGVTYGTFRPTEDGTQFPSPEIVERDFRAMRAAGFNVVRVYTVPPCWLIDLAAANGLRLMIGLPWEQHIAFLDDKARVKDIVKRLEEYVHACARHPAVFCYAVGNEIPASVVRWHGKRRIEQFIGKLCSIVRRVDPDALVTYVNYPTSEYLELPLIDFISFNVYLESKERLAAYLARLQNLAGERPLLLTEVGLDSRRNGEEEQAKSLEWQIAAIFGGGCAGAFVFAWTDEWHRGGYEIEDWDFGLTTRDRQAKPALASVAAAFKSVPFPHDGSWPRVSVVVCSYNGANTIDETLTALTQLNYPDYEVIVVDDGSTDATPSLARKHGVRLIQIENRGLSNARNVGMQAATGEIIAYIDDDAYPDRDWLRYLAAGFSASNHAAIGGPNLAPSGDGLIADAVAHAPGGPVHVLLSDEIAEHIPGCNMAYRLEHLRSIGGFDERFKVAGDDVDICWRFREIGSTLGFSPAAAVWHHRRRSIRAYWKQQKGYAEAEALLADKWPQKYNRVGHLRWSGRLYGKGVSKFFLTRPRIYHGIWGTAPFQSIYAPAEGLLSAIPLMPEWYFLLALFGFLAALGIAWLPLTAMLPVFLLALTGSLIQAASSARKQEIGSSRGAPRAALRSLIFLLHLVQPFARLFGRIRHGIGPWSLSGIFSGPLRLTLHYEIWSEEWSAQEARIAALEQTLLSSRRTVVRGGDFDRWDLEIHGGLLGSARAIAMVEEHGAGKQFFKLKARPHVSGPVTGLFLFFVVLAAFASYDRAWAAAVPLALVAVGVGAFARADCGKAIMALRDGIDRIAKVARCKDLSPNV